MADLILAIDQGTTSTRAIVFNTRWEAVATAQRELKLHYPDNGWVEQNPGDIWHDTLSMCEEVLARETGHITAIGITNQRETVVVWDRKTGAPLYNAIVWQDRRTADLCVSLQDHESEVTQKTGLLMDPYFSATKIKWILDHVPGARARAEKGELAAGTIDCFLLWRLTNGTVHATDATNAARTLLFNVVTQDWDDDLLRLFKIPRVLLPHVQDTAGFFGAASALRNLPVMAMAGDQQAGLFGQACVRPGMVKSTYGTGCFTLVNIGDTFRVSKNRLLTTIAWRLKGKITYAIEGSIFTAGAAVQWLRDGLKIISAAAEAEDMAKSVPDNGGVYLVPAFTGLGAPHWNPAARGTIAGLTRDSTSAHIARAALEAQGYQTADLLNAMADDAGTSIAELRVDGGVAKSAWTCQFIADITGIPVTRPALTEATAQGAAQLAALGAGLFLSPEEIAQTWAPEKTFSPVIDAKTRAALYAGWKKAVLRATL